MLRDNSVAAMLKPVGSHPTVTLGVGAGAVSVQSTETVIWR